MRIIPSVLLICLSISITGIAEAHSPVATKTPTPAADPTATSTPSPQQIARFHGEEWVDGQIARAPITAKIGDVVCGTGGPVPMADVPVTYEIEVVSSDAIPGCGTEGAHLAFMIGDRPAIEMAIWHAGTDTALNLIAGAPFALFSGRTSLTCNDHTERQLLPYVNGTLCGEEKRVETLSPPCGGQLTGYTETVFSALQKPGCGVEGAPITFKLLDLRGNIVAAASETGTWHAWDGVSDPQQLNLTFGPVGGIKMGNVGTGDGSGESRNGSRLAVLLGLAGFAAATLGFGLYRRAMRR